MRFRAATAAVAGSLLLLLTLPGRAAAATGDFTYGFTGPDGRPQRTVLADPVSRECVTIPEAADPGSTSPAFAPVNDTDEVAVVWTNPDCTGEHYVLRPLGGSASERLKLRSVLFF
ncbi:hypothetical protein [Streptomyces sp. CAU 1734]|uniref:hypothetical protein n=1 Tax=Streptomyces sp. CAU 1734 TaxID=3140360 RepID=UPI0032619D63